MRNVLVCLKPRVFFPSWLNNEVPGLEGAGQLSDAMLDIYGKDAFAFVVDEGGGFEKIHGSIFATPAV